MNDNQENKVSMYLAVKTVVDSYGAVWAGVAAFVNGYGLFITILNRILGEVDVQETATTGVRTDKLAAQDVMIEQALVISGAVYAYASDVENNTLMASVSFTLSELKYVRDTISAERARVIHTQATTVVGLLVDYGVDTAMLDEFDTSIDSFLALIPAPRVAITVKKGATSNLVEDVKLADKQLKDKLDKLMPQFKTVSPDFYGQYFDARIIVNYKGGTSKGDISGVVTDVETGNPIKDVEVLTEGKDPVLTDSDGSFNLTGLKAGETTVVFSKAGLQDKVAVVMVVAKQTVVVNVEMVKV